MHGAALGLRKRERLYIYFLFLPQRNRRWPRDGLGEGVAISGPLWGGCGAVQADSTGVPHCPLLPFPICCQDLQGTCSCCKRWGLDQDLVFLSFLRRGPPLFLVPLLNTEDSPLPPRTPSAAPATPSSCPPPYSSLWEWLRAKAG